MTDLVRMSPDEFEALSMQMRLANTARLKNVLDALEPYVEGLVGGGINPAVVNTYVKTVRELGLLWKTYERPHVSGQDEQPDELARQELMVLAARQEAVLAQFEQLKRVGMKEQGRRRS